MAEELSQELIDRLLDTAVENGVNYVPCDPRYIATDMATYAQEVEGRETKELVPFILDWQARRQTEISTPKSS